MANIKSKNSSNDKSMGHNILPQIECNDILNSIADILIQLNSSGKMLWWNKNLDDALSTSIKRRVPTQLGDIFEACSGAEVSTIINGIEENSSTEVDAYLITSEGKKRYHLKCTLIEKSLSKDNKEKEILVVARDVSKQLQMLDEHKQNQNQLQKLLDTLPFLIFLTTTNN